MAALLTGHLREDGVEIVLVFDVDETVVEHTLTFVAEETEDLVLVSHLTRVTLQHTWTSKGEDVWKGEL